MLILLRPPINTLSLCCLSHTDISVAGDHIYNLAQSFLLSLGLNIMLSDPSQLSHVLVSRWSCYLYHFHPKLASFSILVSMMFLGTKFTYHWLLLYLTSHLILCFLPISSFLALLILVSAAQLCLFSEPQTESLNEPLSYHVLLPFKVLPDEFSRVWVYWKF